MKYTEEQQFLFDEYFELVQEYAQFVRVTIDAYDVSDDGQVIDEKYVTTHIRITLKNGSRFLFDQTAKEEAENIAIEAFDYFLSVNQDEEAFEEYLDKHNEFNRI